LLQQESIGQVHCLHCLHTLLQLLSMALLRTKHRVFPVTRCYLYDRLV